MPTLRYWLLGALVGAMITPGLAAGRLMRSNNTPFPTSTLITGASWISRPYGPPRNQGGDILPTVWADDGNQYTMMDDGGTGQPTGEVWKQSLAQIVGAPPRITFNHVGNPAAPAPASFVQIKHNRTLWSGPLGPYYSSGLVEANHVLFATQQNDWSWGTNGLFTGLAGIAYSTDLGQHWSAPAKAFPAPLGNLNWVQRGRGGTYVDGYVYAIATEREFNATNLIMGRSRPGVASMTNPASWQWVSGWRRHDGLPWPVYSRSLASAVPITSWAGHLTYPQMSYDAPLRQYLLTFTHSYGAQPPAVWRWGSELDILAAPHPWGPFSFVAREMNFGPSNGYDPGIPLSWISANGRQLWLKWAANFDGCAGLDCSGGYGFNYRQLQLTMAGQAGAKTAKVARPVKARAMFARAPDSWRGSPVSPKALLRR
ncbi:MAG: DUF4185 domain-containing protein [Candidatus Dormibacteraeota bacterium]|nr:DUF4185 domain-containing protein [Candidatus Dormibacteraeota bacterium]